MAKKEGEQIDTLPIQCYGWDYTNNVPVKILVDANGKVIVNDS